MRNQLQAFRKPTLYFSLINLTVWITILGFSTVAMVFAYAWREQKGYRYLDDASIYKLDLYSSGLESELEKFSYLPSTVELDEDVMSLLTTPSNVRGANKVSKRLTSLNVRAGSITIFILDTQGKVLASSNWYQPDSLVGKNFSSQPYFSQTIQNGQARFFAPSATNETPEYYFAQLIRLNDKPLGIAVVKTSLDPIESTWVAASAHSHGEIFMVIDENDVVIMASLPMWKYKKTPLISLAQQSNLQTVHAPLEIIQPFGLVIERNLPYGSHLVRMPRLSPNMPATQYFMQNSYMTRTGWHLVTLSDASDIFVDARHTAFAGGGLTALIGLFWIYWLQRRKAITYELLVRTALQSAHDELALRSKALQQAHNELELRIEERTTELHETNQNLLREITEHKRTEQVLRAAQDELIQASKLALLGQMSTGITHEINQPLTALRSLSHNTLLHLKRGNMERIEKNLQSIKDLTDRMARITEQLKLFARKAPLTINPVSLPRSIENVLLLLENRLRTEQIQVHIDIPTPMRVLCDGNRLEQVLINLCANALDAMLEAPVRVLILSAQANEDKVLVRVADSGSGIPKEAMTHLFEPFFSTKPAGKGLGLGLAISAGIVREFGGTMHAFNTDEGAAFEFDLNISEENINV